MGFTGLLTITVDHTKIPGSIDFSDFPMLVDITNVLLKTVANGGNVTSTSGHDLVFYADSGAVTKLDYEKVTYNAGSGRIVAWVKVPTLYASQATVIYLHYGNSAITTSQENKTGVWTGYGAVWHLVANADDSTINANNLNLGNGSNIDFNPGGLITNLTAASFYRSQPNYFSIASNSSLVYTASPVVIQAWAKAPAPSGDYIEPILSKWTNVGGTNEYNICYDHTNTSVKMHANMSNSYTPAGALLPVTEKWTMIHATFDGSYVRLFVDGVAAANPGAKSAPLNSSTNSLYIGKLGGDYFNGQLQEIRIGGLARSADWIATEYANQNSTSTFYSVAEGVYVPPASVYVPKFIMF